MDYQKRTDDRGFPVKSNNYMVSVDSCVREKKSKGKKKLINSEYWKTFYFLFNGCSQILNKICVNIR